ncbi:MAG: adenine deaminase [Desulfurococcaceae archaeon]
MGGAAYGKQELLKAIGVALGRAPPDVLIVNARVVDVYGGTIYEGSVAVAGRLIAASGRVNGVRRGDDTLVIDARGGFVVPGFMDSHVHIESAMLVPQRLAEILVPHGTTAIFADPHEIANVLGARGVRLLIDMARGAPLRIFVEVPSRVPTAPGLETTGGELGLGETSELLSLPEAASLGELNYQNLLRRPEEFLDKALLAAGLGKPVNGHLAGASGPEIDAAVAAGLSDDHEALTAEEALERVARGCKVMVREGSTERNLRDILGPLVGRVRDFRAFMFCTDDKTPADIVREGHIDHNVREAIELGVDPVEAIRMATLNIAQHFGLEGLLGSVAPHRLADILILGDLRKVDVRTVIFDGRPVYHEGRLLYRPPERVEIPSWATDTVKIGRGVGADDIPIRVDIRRGRALARAIEVVPGQIVKRARLVELDVVDHRVLPDPSRDVAMIAVIERHRGTGNVGRGFVVGMGIARGALASSVAHDHHNVVVVGQDANDMWRAVERIREIGGGIVATLNGEVVGEVPLRFAGLMSVEPAEEVIRKLELLEESVREVLGSPLRSPAMQLAFVTLPSVPELGLTDRGLIDVRAQAVVSPIIAVEERP